jgi:hypothetical protein
VSTAIRLKIKVTGAYNAQKLAAINASKAKLIVHVTVKKGVMAVVLEIICATWVRKCGAGFTAFTIDQDSRDACFSIRYIHGDMAIRDVFVVLQLETVITRTITNR